MYLLSLKVGIQEIFISDKFEEDYDFGEIWMDKSLIE